ncbi:MAG TPA: hypothetical protein PLI10_06470 [Bacillota bacterium]|nr:hypothetical protein [Bacillota bacterium]HOH09801.1 hypothetical protein [Bacillota bacterium]HOS51043.1 hypothetical protein [Bacillota bacterium]HOY88663.1 hypothetical protein [Bacillota bacterium]HPI01884.1 hypothetical protein [Bacillota bacterium]
MVILQEIIHYIYLIMSGFFGLLLVRALFKRTTRTNLVYDIVYAYAVIPFLLRALRIR